MYKNVKTVSTVIARCYLHLRWYYLYLILYFLRQYSRRDTLILSKRNTLDDVLTFLYIFLKHQRDSLKKCEAFLLRRDLFLARTIPNIFVLLISASFLELETEEADSG